MIDKFEGQYAFLSNFYYSPFEWHGITYPTVEHFFQAAKAKTQKDFDMVMRALEPGEAKRAGRNIQLREDWEEIKEEVMLTALRAKFAIPELRKKLLATGDEELIEGNWWNDTYWGMCNGEGKNRLGMLLMQIREELRNDA